MKEINYNVRILFLTIIRMDASMEKKGATVDVPYVEKISRLFIFRFLWMFIAIWPIYLICIWVGIVAFLHFWYMLFTGKRHKMFFDHTAQFFKWTTDWSSYIMNLTDRRPGFWW